MDTVKRLVEVALERLKPQTKDRRRARGTALGELGSLRSSLRPESDPAARYSLLRARGEGSPR